MPNLEYSVRFVLASDSTSEIDQALAKMRDTGSTITVKVNADVGSFTAEMAKVKSEIEKVESSTEKLSRSTAKGSGLFKMYAKEIRSALNEFRATGDLTKAQATFADISARVGDFGNSMRDSAQGMQEFYTLTNQITSATATLNREHNNSAGVIKANEAVQRSLNEETKKSAQILATRARASKFDSDQAKAANTAMANSVRGVVTELRLLSNSGTATAEQLERLFGRTMTSAKDTQVTTMDLSKAFSQQKAIVEASAAPYHQRMALLKQIRNEEQLAAGQIRNVNRTLGQQENQVGDVSYAMVSFTRLLEDMPYGFRGFANNIQPTVYGLIQLNSTTELMATRFRGIHKREMPLMARAMINLKMALSSPINQLLLLTSVVAVAGTMIERWVQSSNRAKKATAELGAQFLRLYEITESGNPLDTDYSQAIDGLQRYVNALDSVVMESERLAEINRDRDMLSLASADAAMDTQAFMNVNREEIKRLETAKALSKEAEELRKKYSAQLELQEMILSNERVRLEIEQQRLNTLVSSRAQTAGQTLQETRDLLEIEKTRITLGDEAGARKKRDLALLRLDRKSEQEGVAVINERLLVQAQYELESFQIRNRSASAVKEIRNEYDGILMSLQRQLQDEQKMSDFARLQISRRREIADMEAQIAQRREQGEDVLPEQERELIDLINERYDLIGEREAESSARIVANLARQAMLSDDLVRMEQELLFGDEARGIALDLQIQQMEYQHQLADALQEVNEKTYATDKLRLRAVENTTRELRNQYNISLMRQKAEALATVGQFLSAPETEEMRVMQNAQQAMLASTRAFEIERLQLKERFKNSAKLQEVSLTALAKDEAKKREKIERTAAFQIAMIRFAGYSNGLMMITSAFDQLNTSMEAKNRSEFERQKRFSASMATINTFLGVSQVLADTNLTPFMKFATATSMAITGFAQVRQILGTQYGGASTGGGRVGAPSMSEGFVESDVQARQSVNGTINTSQPTMIVNVTGTVDKEGIAWAVMEGTDQINSRGIVLQ
jgi:hypothetical protein